MTPIERAVKALEKLYAADQGAIKHLLSRNVVITAPDFDPGKGVPWLQHTMHQSFDTLDLINALLYAATGGGRIAVKAFHGAPLDFSPVEPQVTHYRAVPVLVYVPLTDDAAADEARAVEQLLEDQDLRVFLAEDFKTAEAVETPLEDLSAMITAACPQLTD